MLRPACLFVLAGLALAGCAEDRKAPYDEIASRAYIHDGPPSLTLYTVVRTADGTGAHSALMVNGPHRVLFDPAGSFEFPTVPERGDVLYGFTPRVHSIYIDFHARETYDVIEQTLPVSSELAAAALQVVQDHGAVPPAACTTSIVKVLHKLPGFDGLRSVLFPDKLHDQFAQLPGVQTRVFTDDDADDNHGVLIQARDILAEQTGQ